MHTNCMNCVVQIQQGDIRDECNLIHSLLSSPFFVKNIQQKCAGDGLLSRRAQQLPDTRVQTRDGPRSKQGSSDDEQHILASLWGRRQQRHFFVIECYGKRRKITSATTAEAKPKKHSPTMTAISVTGPGTRRILRLSTEKEKSILHK